MDGRASSNVYPGPAPGFESVKRYWDSHFRKPAVRLLPGEAYVTMQDELITTLLGSCVAACIRDRVRGIGGMNHFMLPASEADVGSGDLGPERSATRYGNHAMKHLINGILRQGGVREDLEVKVFGGGRIIGELGSVGALNIEFVRAYLRRAGLPLVGEDLGGNCPRKILFFPASGRVLLRRMDKVYDDSLRRREQQYRRSLENKLFDQAIERS